MTLPNGPAGLTAGIEFGITHGTLPGLPHLTQDVARAAIAAEIQASAAWNAAAAAVWDGLQRGVPLVLAIIQGIVQRLIGDLEKQFPATTDVLHELEMVGVGLRGLIPAAIPQFNGTVLAGAAPGFVDNLNGTISYTIQEGQHALSGLIQQADGTVVTAAHVAHQMVASATTAGVSAGQAVASGIAGAANAQGVINSIHNVVNNTVALVDQDVATVEAGLAGFFGGLHAGFTGGNLVSPPPASAADISAAAAALQQRLATIGNGGEELVDVEFSAYSDGALPAVFTAFSGGPSSLMTISGGKLVYNNNATGIFIQYNAATTLTDYQSISGTWSSLSGLSGSGGINLLGRVSATTAVIQATYQIPLNLWTLEGSTSGGVLQWQMRFADTFTPGATYTLLCGDAATLNPYKFQLLKNGTPLIITANGSGPYASQVGQTFLNDSGSLSFFGGSNRACGTGAFSCTMAMSSFLFQDTTQSSPAVLVTTSESTASTTYTDLATISDDVAVTIGTSGLAQVNISAQLSNNVATGDSLVSFALSGANTQAASNTFAISIPCTTSHFTQAGSSFLLTGLAPGLTVFKMKYAAQSGTTATFANRRISVVAL